MAISTHLTRYAGRKLAGRLSRSIPWIGGAIALITLGSAIRRKGFLGGTMHTALDAIPFVGGAKTLVELGRGRDFFPDRAYTDTDVRGVRLQPDRSQQEKRDPAGMRTPR